MSEEEQKYLRGNMRLGDPQLKYSYYSKNEKRIFWYSFFMACPIFILYLNISFFIFPFLFFGMLADKSIRNFLSHGVQWLSLFFAIGAVISTFSISDDPINEYRDRSLLVIFNYLYWPLLVSFMILARNRINYPVVYKALFWGVILSIFHYFLFQKIGILAIPFVKKFTQNTFSFLLICFSPIAAYYIRKTKGMTWALWFALAFSVAGFLSGSRAGSILVTLGSFFAIFFSSPKVAKVFWAISLIILSGPFIFDSPHVQKLIFQLNERTYDMIYGTEKMLAEDRSFLARRAMVEKGLLIFEEHPMTGIGLNNFIKTDIDFVGNFVGAKFVIQKENLDEISSHNSYINILAEGGLLLFVPFILILSTILITFVTRFKKINPDHRPVFIGFFFMCIHFYFITSVVNVFAWFLVGLAASIVYKET
jgi:O-antigen ligase